MDKRLIEHVASYEKAALKLVAGMQPVTFKRRGSVQDHLGLTSQDLQSIEPMLVNTVGNVQTVDYERLTVVLIKAIQELNAKVIALEGQQTLAKKSKAKTVDA